MFRMKSFHFILAFIFSPIFSVNASVVTLGQPGLMSLDYHNAADSLTARVVDKRLSGQGVEFDILFAGNSGSDSQMFYGSSVFDGDGALVFEDLSSFDYYQIDVQLLEVHGYTSQQAESFELSFSPMVYDSDSYKYFSSELISTAAGNDAATASMDISFLAAGNSVSGDWIFEIGYEIHMDDPDVWPADETMITLLLSPTDGATQLIPEPITILLLGFGGLMLRKRRVIASKVLL